jgi:Flp pilus assembly pilin Flp
LEGQSRAAYAVILVLVLLVAVAAILVLGGQINAVLSGGDQQL